MRASGKAAAALLVVAALLVAGGTGAQAEDRASDEPGLVRGEGFVIIDPGSAQSQVSAKGTFYPTGEVSPGTLVVIRNDDGSLPGDISVAELEELIAAQAEGDVHTIEAAGFTVVGGEPRARAATDVTAARPSTRAAVPGGAWSPASTICADYVSLPHSGPGRPGCPEGTM